MVRKMFSSSLSFFFFNDTATTEIYTLSLHDALPICVQGRDRDAGRGARRPAAPRRRDVVLVAATQGGVRAVSYEDRKSTRLNSSHANISYAVFCLKKKKYLHSRYDYYNLTTRHFITH